MDSGLTMRPTSAAAQATGVRQDAPTLRGAVTTSLAPSQTVTAAARPTEARQNGLQSDTIDPGYVRKIILDAQSREVIYRSRDVRSGRVGRQVPREALLRLKAYTRVEPDDEPDAESLEKLV